MPLFAQPSISPQLEGKLLSKSDDEFIGINIELSGRFSDHMTEVSKVSGKYIQGARDVLVAEMKHYTAKEQEGLIDFLHKLKGRGQVRKYKSFWLTNLIYCEASPAAIQKLMTQKGLASISLDSHQEIEDLQVMEQMHTPELEKELTADTTWSVDRINAPRVWQEGITGKGVLVGIIDSGVNYNHLDLQGNMWQHPDYPYHGYNFWDDDYDSMDPVNHGTHCAGIVAGNGAGGRHTGVAPDAGIMSLRVMSDGGRFSETAVLKSLEFGVEHGVDIFNISLGLNLDTKEEEAYWRDIFDNLLHLGVVSVAASGNHGRGYDGNRPPPGNVAQVFGAIPPPWLHPDQTLKGGKSGIITVGATTDEDSLAGFSSRGPVTWQNHEPYNDYPYDPEMGLIRPDVVAPGAEILSLLHYGESGYTRMSGTSMATPAVAGVLALMLSDNPALTPRELSQRLELSARALTETKSNRYGSGLADAYEAVKLEMGLTLVDYAIGHPEGKHDGLIKPGEKIVVDITVVNHEDRMLKDAKALLKTGSSYVSFTDSVISLGDVLPGDTVSVESGFAFDVYEGAPGLYDLGLTFRAYEKDFPENFWSGFFSETIHGPKLKIVDSHIDDSEFGNDDGFLDPGETASLHLTLANIGQLISAKGDMSVSVKDEWMTVLSDDSVGFPKLAPGDSVDITFQIAAVHDVPHKTTSSVVSNAESGAHSFTEDLEFLIGEFPYYTDGDIPTTMKTPLDTDIDSRAEEPGVMTVSIPEGAEVTGVDVKYSMTSREGAWRSDQRSFLRCVSPGGGIEPEVYVGTGSSGGSLDYHRTGLDIANDVEGGGDIEFELHAFRSYGGEGSNTDYVYVDDGSWKVVVHYELPKYDITFLVENQLEEYVEGATLEVGRTSTVTNEEGAVQMTLPEGRFYYTAMAEGHRPVVLEPFEVSPEDETIGIDLLRVFEVAFVIRDVHGSEVEDPLVILEGDTLAPGEYHVSDLPDGDYSFLVEADGYAPYEGTFTLTDSDLEVEVSMLPYYKAVFIIEGQWGEDVPDAEIRIDDQTYPEGEYEIDELVPGDYSYVVSAEHYFDHTGDFSITDEDVEVEVALESDWTSLEELSDGDFRIYPNPASDVLRIEGSDMGSGPYEVQLVNLSGQVVKEREITASQGQFSVALSLSGIHAGMHIVEIRDGDQVFTNMVVIR